MSFEQKRQYIFGGAAALAVVIFVLAVFSFWGRTNIVDITMDPGPTGDWEYELISGASARPAEPVDVDDFTVSFPGETARAVRASRILGEEMEYAQIGVYLYDAVCGVDILLDGEMFFTSFEGAPRDAGGFAEQESMKPAKAGTYEMNLPEDYLGRRLTVVTYFPSETENIVPVFPYLCNVDTNFSVTSVVNVYPVSLATISAILAFLTALVYILDISNGKADKKVLMLTLFYIMLFLKLVFSSIAGTYSLLYEKLYALDFICELYIAPLLMFAAFSLTSWRRWVLAGATAVWFAGDSIKLIRFRQLYGPFYGQATAPVILVLYLLALAMIAAEMKLKKERRPKKADIVYIFIAVIAAVTHIILYSSEWDLDVRMYLEQLFVSPLHGYFYPLVIFISSVCAVTATAAVILEFIKRTVRTRETMRVLEEQNRRAMEGYRRMEEAEIATNAARHEMRHHMLAIQGMLKNGNAGGAEDYIASVEDMLDSLPTAKYSRNMMVNIIAGFYLDRAAREGVKVKCRIDIPEKLNLPDNDLCVFLTNMLENAVNACERMDSGADRFINVSLSLDGSTLFLGCEKTVGRAGKPAARAVTE